jgi:hypothetical protein
MAQTFNTITFEKQLSILENCSKWMVKLGIDITNTRFEKILTILRVIVEHYKQDNVSELYSKYNEATLFHVLTDATAFMKIFLFLKDKKSHQIPRKKIIESISGPILPWEEEPKEGTSHSRNTVFELETAVLFHEAGLEIKDFDDVRFIFDNYTFNVQCKRIHSPKRIADNIKEAATQILKQNGNKSKAKGIIFLCIDKLTEKEKVILEVNHEKDIGPHLEMITWEFIQTYNHLWRNLITINVLGTAIFIKILANIKRRNKPMLTVCRHRMLDIIPDKIYQPHDYLLIKKLSAKLGSSFAPGS